jgi:two-component system cell cycle response regulator
MGHQERILVADDSALMRRMLGDVLKGHGWAVLEASDGATTLATARAEEPDVLLMAREMAGLDGMAVLDALRTDERTRDMPVVFVTGHTDARELAEALERGAHDYVRKPVEPLELVARVRTAMRLRALRDQLAQRNAELEELARTDVLTGLANRRHADDVLRKTIASARRHERELCAVLVDIDNFKAVNDARGHGGGDALLIQVAQRWSEAIRPDDVLARVGGDEFAVLMPACTAAEAAYLIGRLRARMPSPDTCSVGVATWDGAELPDRLVLRADAALYEAKREGRDRVSSGLSW